MKKIVLFSLLSLYFSSAFTQIPAGYYNHAHGHAGKELQIILSQLIDNHQIVSYASLWHYFQQTDLREDSLIWDIYSDNPAGVSSYNYTIFSDQCGQVGSGEGHCYNREHTFCQSWFGGGTGAPYSDLFHIYPVDGYINSTRNNYAYGIVTSPLRTFSNGSKYGKNQAAEAPNVNAFEPIDEYKGDIARSFFYMATRYMFEDQNFESQSPMTYKSQLQPWALEMFLNWHLLDPVSDKERNRNNAIYTIQQNRNPFIDYPELVGKIWSSDSIHPFLLDDTTAHFRPKIDYFEVQTEQILKLHADMPLTPLSVLNMNNYAIQSGITISEIQYFHDTIYLHLEQPLQKGKTYHLIIRNLQAENQYFISDTSISFIAGIPVHQTLIAAWTFDQLEGKPSMQREFMADIMISDFALLCMNGSYGSTVFNTSGSGGQWDAFSGTVIGDPRGSQANASKSLGIIGEGSNGKSIVLAISTRNFQQLHLTFSCRRTASGFTEHQWEWSTNGSDYQIIENSNTAPESVAEFELRTVDLQFINNKINIDTLFLRLTVEGASSSSGNNRLDNILLYGETSNNIKVNERDENELFFQVYPNPSQRKIAITLQDSYPKNYQLRSYTLQGKQTHHFQLQSTYTELDYSNWPSGIYILVIYDQTGNKSSAKRVIIQK